MIGSKGTNILVVVLCIYETTVLSYVVGSRGTNILTVVLSIYEIITLCSMVGSIEINIIVVDNDRPTISPSNKHMP